MKSKIATIGLSLALGLSMVAPASALTVAELQAQINALMAQLAALQGGSASAGVTFTSDLTVGSTGAQVSALQQVLVSNGYLVMPAGVAMGYFGSLTKAAVMKWQAAVGLPATGFFGPMSRAKLNGSAGATGTVPGTTIGGSTSVGGVITTPGVEGTLTVTRAASPASGQKLYEGSMKVGVLGIELEAKTSDIKVERIKLDLDESGGTNNDQDFYRKIAQKVYVMDGSTVLASMDLSTATVVEDGSDRFITLSGLSFVVPKDSKRVLTIALDARSNWDSAFDGDSWTIGVAVEGVRGVDGAGVNQYGPSTAFSNSFTSEGELADSATLTVSTNSGTVQDMVVIAASGSSENEKDGVELLRADFRAEKDAVTITDLVVDVVRTGSGAATTTTGYLYAGDTLLDSDSVDTDTHSGFTFDDIDYVVPKDTTRTLTVKVDIDSANGTAAIFTADIDTNDVTSENSNGTSVTESGSAQGESVTVRNVGLEYTLVSKNVTYTAGGAFAGATSTAKADFVLRIKAVGSAIEFGDAASTTYAIAEQDNTLAAGESFVIYRGGAAVNPDVSSSTSITVPSGVTAAGTNSWVLGEGNSVDLPISFVMETRDDDSYALITTGAYAFGLERINWLANSTGRQTDTFMSGNSAWRTSTVTLP
jgi:peptidoglycan hydrolase-like protein with peptidoglycan-binding domain